MDIIELLADAGAGLTISEISKRLKRRMSELFRIVIVMERRGWLQKDHETARYSVTYQLLKLAHRGAPAQSLATAAAPVMQELATRVNQSCHLVVRAGSQGLVIYRHENPNRHANLSVRMGAVLELARSCSGHLLLAFLEPTQRDSLMRSLPRASTLPRARLEKLAARIRKRGYELQRSQLTPGVTDISYPIRGLDGGVMAALTVPYLHVLDDSLPTSVEQTRQLLEQAARRISRSLGGPG
jgi:DNA-binding IclR family transcriptional regulator